MNVCQVLFLIFFPLFSLHIRTSRKYGFSDNIRLQFDYSKN